MYRSRRPETITLAKMNRDFLTELEGANAEVASLTSEMASLRAKLATTESQVKTLTEERDREREHLSVAMAQRTEADASLAGLRAQVATVTGERDLELANLAQARKEISRLRASLGDVDTTIRERLCEHGIRKAAVALPTKGADTKPTATEQVRAAKAGHAQ